MVNIINKPAITGLNEALPITSKFVDGVNERSTSTETAVVLQATIESAIVAIAELEGIVNGLLRALDAKRVD